MIETMKELKSELRGIRQDIRMSGMRADPVIVASWLDRMAICMEKAMDSVDLMQERVDVMSGPAFRASGAARKAGAGKPARRKAAKKPARKKTAKKKASRAKKAKRPAGKRKR